MVLLAFGIGHAQQQHVLGQPALVTAHGGSDAQGEALLAQQRVAAVARAVGPDLAGLGVVNDVLGVGVARPGHVLLTSGQGGTHGVHARHELAIGAEHIDHALAHAGHQLHVDGHVGAVGQLNANVGDVRTQRAHREGHDVHRAAGHGALEQGVGTGLQLGAHFSGLAPVVGGAGIFLASRADEGAVFHAGHVGGVGPGEVGVRAQLGVELLERAGSHELGAQAVVLFGGAVAPDDVLGLQQGGHLGHPGNQLGVFDVGRCIDLSSNVRHDKAPESKKQGLDSAAATWSGQAVARSWQRSRHPVGWAP